MMDDEEESKEGNNDDDNTINIRMIEFFSGIGGMRLSVLNALKKNTTTITNTTTNLDYCQAYDISLYANSTYQYNFHELAKTKLVEQLTTKDLDSINANLWTMSPPCQPFTHTTRGGNNNNNNNKNLDINDKRCNGLKSLMTNLNQMRQNNKPKWIFLENVKGFVSSQMLQQVKQTLTNNGYTYKQYLLSPIQFGIPNHRQRYYLLCERSNRFINIKQDEIFTIPPPTTTFSSSSKVLTPHQQQQRRSIMAEYLDHQPQQLLPSGNNNNNNNINNYYYYEKYIVPKSILQKPWAKNLSIVTPNDDETYCFTAGYGRIYHKSTGSLLLIESPKPTQTPTLSSSTSSSTSSSSSTEVGKPQQQQQEEADDKYIKSKDLDRSDMTKYDGKLRRFTPNELLKLFGFIKNTPETNSSNIDTTHGTSFSNVLTTTTATSTSQQQDFDFPSNISLEHQYKLIGNSINVTVVTSLMEELLLFPSTSSSISQQQQEQEQEQQQNVHNMSTIPSSCSTASSSSSLLPPPASPSSSSPSSSYQQHPSQQQIQQQQSKIITVGGIKGHQMESIEGFLLQLYQACRWKMIPNCTGRYTCRDHNVVSILSPLQLLEQAGILSFSNKSSSSFVFQEYHCKLPDRDDMVIIVPLDVDHSFGIITFVKDEKRQQQEKQEEKCNSSSNISGKEVEEVKIKIMADAEEGEGERSSQQQPQRRQLRYIHTLNTKSGFQRKLEAIGIHDMTNFSSISVIRK